MCRNDLPRRTPVTRVASSFGTVVWVPVGSSRISVLASPVGHLQLPAVVGGAGPAAQGDPPGEQVTVLGVEIHAVQRLPTHLHGTVGDQTPQVGHHEPVVGLELQLPFHQLSRHARSSPFVHRRITALS